MIYKKEIGCHIVDRKAFLERWIPATLKPPTKLVSCPLTAANVVLKLNQPAPPTVAPVPRAEKPKKQKKTKKVCTSHHPLILTRFHFVLVIVFFVLMPLQPFVCFFCLCFLLCCCYWFVVYELD